jgi:hypothetical protein
MPHQITSWATQSQGSLSNAVDIVVAAVPRVVAFLIIVAIGWLIADVVRRIVTGILVRAHLNNWMHRSGLAAAFTYGGVEPDAIGFVSMTATWFIRLIALVAAFDALGLRAVAEILRQLSLWLPNLVVALVVLVVGGLAANALTQLVGARAAAIDPRNSHRLAAAIRVAVWVAAIVFAANQVGIASGLLAALFTALVASFALAFGLAFGLGAHEIVRDVIRNVYLPMRWPDALGKKPSPPRVPEQPPLRREH